MQNIINYITHGNLYFIGTIFALNAELKGWTGLILRTKPIICIKGILNWNQAQIEIYLGN